MDSKSSAQNKERVEKLFSRIEVGIKAVFEGDNYRNYLSTMAKFHRYSYRNSLLIQAQSPNATKVAGYKAWQTNFNRQVRKGEQGIQILGYTPRTVYTLEQKLGPNGAPILDKDGNPVMENVPHKIPAYIPVYVYDISQTVGDPLPEIVYNLEGDTAIYQDLMSACSRVSPYPIEFEDIPGAVRGYCDDEDKRIAIRNGLSQVHTIKTAIHELTHATLHSTAPVSLDRGTEEVQAESVAFIVCDHYGIDTSDYSFPYLATWSRNHELKTLHNSLDTIQRHSAFLIDQLDTQLKELTKEREIREGLTERATLETLQAEIQADTHLFGDVQPDTLATIQKAGYECKDGDLQGIKSIHDRLAMAQQMTVQREATRQSQSAAQREQSVRQKERQ